MSSKKWEFPVSGDGWFVVFYIVAASLLIGLAIYALTERETRVYVVELRESDPVSGKHLYTEDGQVCLNVLAMGEGRVCYPLTVVKRWYSVKDGNDASK